MTNRSATVVVENPAMNRPNSKKGVRVPKPPVKAQAVAADLAPKIFDGTYPAESWLPAERELAEKYQADRSTIRRALMMLEAQGLLTVHKATGAQVRSKTSPEVRRHAEDVTRQVGSWRGFHLSAMETGRQPYTRTQIDDEPADTEIARWLGVPVETVVLKRARIQGIVDGPPVQTSVSWITPEIAARIPILRQIDTGPGGMYSRFEDAGLTLTFEDVVTCRLPDSGEQQALEVGLNQPVLVVWRRCYGQAGQILEVTRRVIVGDRQQLIYRY
jgi:GntR family transcriptional regulator